MNTDTAQKAKTQREKPLIGPRVAKQLLQALREMRQFEAKGLHSMKYRITEEIEAWEDLIRESVKNWRKTPREVLKLDSETTAALDDTCLSGRRNPATDSEQEYRRRFALRAIRAVCQAWVDSPKTGEFSTSPLPSGR
jgi:uncharacterized protein YjiS (DUF1127 family)